MVPYARAAAALKIQPCISQHLEKYRGYNIAPLKMKSQLQGPFCSQILQAEARGFLLIIIPEITKPSVDAPPTFVFIALFLLLEQEQ